MWQSGSVMEWRRRNRCNEGAGTGPHWFSRARPTSYWTPPLVRPLMTRRQNAKPHNSKRRVADPASLSAPPSPPIQAQQRILRDNEQQQNNVIRSLRAPDTQLASARSQLSLFNVGSFTALTAKSFNPPWPTTLTAPTLKTLLYHRLSHRRVAPRHLLTRTHVSILMNPERLHYARNSKVSGGSMRWLKESLGR